MSGYSFKGIAINTMTSAGSGRTASNSFVNFPTGTGGSTFTTPYTLGYTDSSGDMSNRCVAQTVTYYNSINVSPPTGCKAFRYAIIGGGGGGGGGGGHSHMGSNNSNQTVNNNGASGGQGQGAIAVQSNTDVPYTGGSISITIGNGGDNGPAGENANNNVNYNENTASSKGGDGGGNNNGNTWLGPNNGNATTLTYGTLVVNSAGGQQGGYGQGGYSSLTNGGNTGNSNDGNLAGSDINGPQVYNINSNNNAAQYTGNFLAGLMSGAGMGGNAGNGSTSGNIATNGGGNGSQGAAVLIYLYG